MELVAGQEFTLVDTPPSPPPHTHTRTHTHTASRVVGGEGRGESWGGGGGPARSTPWSTPPPPPPQNTHTPAMRGPTLRGLGAFAQVNDFDYVGDAKTIGQSYPRLSQVLEAPPPHTHTHTHTHTHAHTPRPASSVERGELEGRGDPGGSMATEGRARERK